MTRKEKLALDTLLTLIRSGVEYPDAEWEACNHGFLCDASRLRDLYDAHVAGEMRAEQRKRVADRVDGYDRDDLGLSPD